MKKTLLSVLFLVLMCGIAMAKEPIVDSGSPNIWSTFFGNDRRQVDANVPFNRASGDYFLLNVMVKIGNLLDSYDDIKTVKVTHTSGYEFNLRLVPNCIFWPDVGDHRQYYEFIRSEGWMYTGTWTIELKYKGSDGEKHLQYRDFSMQVPYIMPSLQNVAVDKLQDGSFLVSWSYQGGPASQTPSCSPGDKIFDYRVMIYDLTMNNFNCPDHAIYGDWRGGIGWFDPATRKVYFPISSEHAGKAIRLETRALVCGLTGWINHRSARTMMLP